MVVLFFGGSVPPLLALLPLPDFAEDDVFSVSVGGLSLPSLPLAPLPPVGGGGGGGFDVVSFVDLLRMGLKCTDLCG